MATAQHFEDLQVWQDARALVKDIYAASKQRDFYRDVGLREQIRRAATSAKYPSNSRVRKTQER